MKFGTFDVKCYPKYNLKINLPKLNIQYSFGNEICDFVNIYLFDIFKFLLKMNFTFLPMTIV